MLPNYRSSHLHRYHPYPRAHPPYSEIVANAVNEDTEYVPAPRQGLDLERLNNINSGNNLVNIHSISTLVLPPTPEDELLSRLEAAVSATPTKAPTENQPTRRRSLTTLVVTLALAIRQKFKAL